VPAVEPSRRVEALTDLLSAGRQIAHFRALLSRQLDLVGERRKSVLLGAVSGPSMKAA